MAEKQKPQKRVVRKAAKGMKSPRTSKIQKSEDARIMDDQRNDPLPNREASRKKKHPKTVRKVVRSAPKRVTKKAAPRKAVKRAVKRGRKR